MFTDELLIHLIRTISQDIIYRLIPVNMIATRIVDLFIRLEFLIRGFFVRQILCGRTLARLFYYRCGRMQRLFRQSNLTSLFCRTMHSFLNTVDPLVGGTVLSISRDCSFHRGSRLSITNIYYFFFFLLIFI